MMTALIVSNVLAWITVVALGLVVLALTRQVGLLHERIAPAGALTPTSGPKVGEAVDQTRYTTLAGGDLVLGGHHDASRLLLFVSPTCPVCKGLVPVARRLASQEGLNLAFASDGDNLLEHERYVDEMELAAHPYVLSQPLGISFGVSKLPFAVLIDTNGVLAAKGLVNTREHLESLLEAAESGVPTLQAHLATAEEQR
ncbi:MAG: thiol-disulfide isomerase [Gammaproteobacteria bacterium]|nr:thiol-disulfide isomerase [Gammaproteobacteria bacterium]|tara:strand:+ start:1684 stop:2280 length:597 start_codon:yes stop_codon:yes gene_type:complete